MSCKPDFLHNTGIRRSLQVSFLTGELCILEEFPLFDRIFHKMEKPILVWNALQFTSVYSKINIGGGERS
jgi:hypothetical protein